MIKPAYLLLRVPDGISLKHAALACCALGPGFNAVQRTRVTATDTVLISGCGPVGLGAIINAVHRGARVIAIEPNPYRAALALELGAELVVDPRELDRARTVLDGGASCGIETAGLPGSAALVLSLLRPLSRLALLAWNVPIELPPLVPTGVEIHGSWHWNHQRDGDEMWALITSLGDALDEIVTHEFDFADVSDAMDLQDSGECGKILMVTE